MKTTYKNTQIHYQIRGQGTPLVLLHGYLENSTMWEALLPELVKKYQVITIDLLGHGQTECLGYVHSMETMAKAVRTALEQESIPPAIVIGHSMGGYVSLAIAEAYPDRVAALVLLNSTAKADSTERKLNRDRGIQVVKKNPTAYTSMAIANLFASENQALFPTQIAKIKQEAAQTPLQGIIAAQEGMKIREDRTTVLKNFKGTKLLIAGKQDPVLDYSQLEKEAQNTNTKFISLDGGHMSHVENFEEILEITKGLQ